MKEEIVLPVILLFTLQVFNFDRSLQFLIVYLIWNMWVGWSYLSMSTMISITVRVPCGSKPR